MEEINHQGTNERSSAIEGAVALMREGLRARALEDRVKALQKSNLKKLERKCSAQAARIKKLESALRSLRGDVLKTWKETMELEASLYSVIRLTRHIAAYLLGLCVI